MQHGKLSLARVLPFILIIGGAVGIMTSGILTLDKIELIKNPSFHPICNLNPVFSCTSVVGSPQASAFGIPNTIIGLSGYAMVLVVGVMMLAGGQTKKWFWRLFNLGLLGAILFIHWLIAQTLYVIGALCLFCIVTWVVTAPVFWYTTLYNIKEDIIPVPPRLKPFANALLKYHDVILASWYFLIVLLIVQRFWSFFSTLI